MPQNSRIFYQFLGVHSLLIGIFPFYLPVYLWKEGFDLGAISFFIALSGLGFCLGMWVWDRLRWKIDLIGLMGVSFAIEIVLLLVVQFLEMGTDTLIFLGIVYGIYNSFFWTTQRALFFDLVTVDNSGRKYGNFQIFVGLLLQIGILIGGLLLETTSFVYLLYVSMFIGSLGMVMLWKSKPSYPETLTSRPSIKIKDVIAFKDAEFSRTIFFVDGFYLFLESFFWVISLFLLAHESFTKLGLMVMALAVIFGILFYLLKNTIDKLGRKRIYFFAVILYSAAWVLRALVEDTLMLEILFVFLVSITFFTSFFRLAMNKRFYDLAKTTLSHDYLILKSYYSQISIAICFGLVALASTHVQNSDVLLEYTYWIAAALAPTFFLYGMKRYR